MRKIEDILNELWAHPNMAHFEFFTFDRSREAIVESFKKWIEQKSEPSKPKP